MLRSLGEQVATLRREIDLSRESLAERIDCHPNTLAMFERGLLDVSCVIFTRTVARLGCDVVKIRAKENAPEILLERGPSSKVIQYLCGLPPKRMVNLMGRALRQRRETAGMSLEKLSKSCGLHRNTIWTLEQADVTPSTTTVYRLLTSLDVQSVTMVDGKTDLR